MNKRPLLASVMRTLKRNPLTAVLLAASVACSVILALLPPLVLERAVNMLTGSNSVTDGEALTVAIAYFALYALYCLSDSFKSAMITVCGQKLTKGLRTDMCRKLTLLPAYYFSKTDPGITVSRFTGDVDKVEEFFSAGVAGMAADLFEIIGILSVIAVKCPGLGLIMLIVTPVIFVFTRFVQKKMLKAQINNRRVIGRLSDFIPETVRSIRMIHVLRAENHMEDRYDDSLERSYRAVDRANFCDAIYSPVIYTVRAAVVAVMMILAVRFRTGIFAISVGTSVALVSYIASVFGPIESIGMEIQTVQSAVAGTKRIREFLLEAERTPGTKKICATDAAPAVDFSDVTFSYDGKATVLDGLSFSVNAGEQVTLAGRTGAGKSTAFRLILGLYAPLSGQVRIFGTDAGEISDESKRFLFGCVDQSFRPVPGTVGDQIRLFTPGLSDRDVEKAAKLSGIHEIIKALPQGYDTPYSDALFSDGQRQLLSIAAAVVTNPPVLLLDEITAGLDSGTEHRVLEALEAASGGRTVISISHRLYEHRGGRIIGIGIQTDG